ncbi:hypothetical protein [Magnetovibrio sp.]
MLTIDVLIALILAVAAPVLWVHFLSLQTELKPAPVRSCVRNADRAVHQR